MKQALRGAFVLLPACLLAGCAGGPNAWKMPFTAKKQNVDRSHHIGGEYSMEFAKARNLESTGELDKAREIYMRLRQQDPRDANVLHRLGVVADKQRRHSEAQQFYTEAIRAKPRDPELFNDLGYCFYLQNQLAKSESALRKALQLNPDSTRSRINLGMALGHQGRIEEAFGEFSKAGGKADAYYNLASVYAFQDNFEEAKNCFRQALVSDPNHILAKQSLDNFQRYESNEEPGHTALAREERGYVPFVENGEGGATTGEVAHASYESGGSRSAQPASYRESLPTGRQATSAARNLHRRSRGLMNRNMSSARQGIQ